MGGGKYQTQVVYKGLNEKMLKYEQYINSMQSNKTTRPITLIDEETPELVEQESLFDELRAGCKAQYTNADGTPIMPWTGVSTPLSSINTKELHYVRLPKEHIVIDLDVKDQNGDKQLALCLKAARQFPEHIWKCQNQETDYTFIISMRGMLVYLIGALSQTLR